MRKLLETVSDIVLGAKDFVYGSIMKPLENTYSWSSWAFKACAIAGIVLGLATGHAGVALGLMFIAPAAIGVAAGAWGVLTGGISEVMKGQAHREAHRDIAARTYNPEPHRHQEREAPAPAPARVPADAPASVSHHQPSSETHANRPLAQVSDAELLGKLEQLSRHAQR